MTDTGSSSLSSAAEYARTPAMASIGQKASGAPPPWRLRVSFFTTDASKADRREARHKPGDLRMHGELRSRHRQRIRTVRRDRKPNESPRGIDRDLYNRPSALVSSSVAMAIPSEWR
jgi:hypothetical protein